jgi:hypothetical protein
MSYIVPLIDFRLSKKEHVFCVGISSLITRAITHPLNVLQVSKQMNLLEMYYGYKIGINFLSTQGIYGFYKGFLTNTTKCFLHYSIVFSIFNILNNKFQKNTKKDFFSLIKTLFFSSFSGMAATIITHPLDTLTCRLIQDFGDKNKLFINLYSYKGIRDCIEKTLTQESYRSFFNGYRVAILSGGLFLGITFTSYEIFESLSLFKNRHELALLFISSLIGQTLTYPLHTTKRLMQGCTSTLPKIHKPELCGTFSNTRSCIMLHIQSESISRLFCGYIMNVFKLIPFTLIMYYSYSFLKKPFIWLNSTNNDDYQ